MIKTETKLEASRRGGQIGGARLRDRLATDPALAAQYHMRGKKMALAASNAGRERAKLKSAMRDTGRADTLLKKF